MELVMRVMPMPKDANGNGDIFGGWIMAQVDLAPACCRRASRAAAWPPSPSTSSCSRNAVSVGDLLSFYARVEKIGRTSITVHVEVWAERRPLRPDPGEEVTEANVTYVAIDRDGRPRPAQPMTPTSPCAPSPHPPAPARFLRR